jgi:hypothetical protein
MVPVILYILIDSYAYDWLIGPIYDLWRGFFEVDGYSCVVNDEGFWPRGGVDVSDMKNKIDCHMNSFIIAQVVYIIIAFMVIEEKLCNKVL